jgi:amino acid transporter
MAEPQQQRRELIRGLGVSHATAVVVGTIIGSGIFLVPREMMQAVGTAKMVYLAWIVGGILSFFGALTYSELGAMKPESGGEYAYIRDAFGPLWSFLYAWTWFIIAKPASIATVTMGVVRVLSRFEAMAFLQYDLTISHGKFTISLGQFFAIALAISIPVVLHRSQGPDGARDHRVRIRRRHRLIRKLRDELPFRTGRNRRFLRRTCRRAVGLRWME